MGRILAIPTVVFSLYGMNFSFMPELKFHYAYPLVIGVTAVLRRVVAASASGRMDLSAVNHQYEE